MWHDNGAHVPTLIAATTASRHRKTVRRVDVLQAKQAENGFKMAKAFRSFVALYLTNRGAVCNLK